MIAQILFIGGRDLELAKYAVDLLGKEFYAEAFNFFETNQYIKRTLKRFPKIFILYKRQEDEFKERWLDIYSGKEISCFDIPEEADMKEQRKQLRKKLMPYLKKILDDIMKELMGGDENFTKNKQ